MLEIGFAVAILLLLLACLEAGFRGGRRAATTAGDAAGGSQIGAVQGAALGLLGLLLAFSFGGAASRYMERQRLIIQEANAIGTACLRAELLDEPWQSELRTALADYLTHRIRVSTHLRYGLSPETAAEIRLFHERIWKAAQEGVRAKPATMVVVLPPVNEVIDLHATRVATEHVHLPTVVLGLLVLCSALAIGVIGFGCGLTRRRCPTMTISLTVLVTAALYTTIDFDHPGIGLIRTSDSPLIELETGLRR
ncbi:MAG TPA: hypothetical protein PKG54_18465 [Phycisphaerae bacterium]|jgi:hypothetical protein|nr:hypothetical protein [Phycisphaerae bacterium]HOB76497.1 hypothetical protein [Phycisphaerae bacterium]HOJ53704.1 hypothetical protein [Phycisphaerae bacterium]HOL27977.1 hypothetical protein [Phycisphaerae bacterium]HPP22376.1 hypothetical protein [Phycisphaerae bacterium]